MSLAVEFLVGGALDDVLVAAAATGKRVFGLVGQFGFSMLASSQVDCQVFLRKFQALMASLSSLKRTKKDPCLSSGPVAPQFAHSMQFLSVRMSSEAQKGHGAIGTGLLNLPINFKFKSIPPF